MFDIAGLSCFSGAERLAITETMTCLAGKQIALTLQFGNFLHLRGIQQRVIAFAVFVQTLQQGLIVPHIGNLLGLVAS